MSRKELWEKATEEIDDKYIEEAAQTIIRKAGTPIDMNKADIQRTAVKSSSRSLPVILSAAAAIAMVVGAGYILDKYDISMSSTHDGEQTTTVTEDDPVAVTPSSVSDELYKLKWGMTVDEVTDCLTFKPDSRVNYTEKSTLQYKNLSLGGYPASLEINVSNEEGLNDISYRIITDDTESVFNTLAAELHTKSGIYDPINETLSRWHFDAAGYTVSIADKNVEIIYSFIPLVPVEDRYYTFLEEQEKAKRPEYSWTNVKADKIDQYADPWDIVLEKAERLQTLSNNYLHYVEENLAYEIGDWVEGENIHDTYEVISEEMKTYEDFKNLFSDSVHGEFFDYINTGRPRLTEIDGKLCYTETMGGYLGIIESWFIGYDWDDDKITGHFAALKGIDDIECNNAEHLNDINNYQFYDIVIQNVDGKYVITDCYNAETGNNEDSYQTHGYFYNSGLVDRTLITNEKVMPADYRTSTSIARLGDDRKVTLICDYDNSDMTIQLRQYNVLLLDELKTGIAPSTNGNETPKLHTLNLASGTLIYLTVPKDDGSYKIYLYAVIDGKLKRFNDQNGPLIIESDTDTLDNIALSDHIFASKVSGESRKHYTIDFREAKALLYYRYPDIDPNTELVNFADLEFIPYDENAEYLCKGDWNVTFDGMGFADEGSTFSFSTAINASETDKAWFFTDISGGPRGGSGAELYVIFKDNPDLMYFYHEPLYADKTAFCNYDMVFERTQINNDRKSVHNINDFQFTATLEPEQTVRFTTTDPATGKTILEIDTGITVKKVSYSNGYGSGTSSDAGTYVMNFGDKNVVVLYVSDSYSEGTLLYRIYYFDVEKNSIIPFLDGGNNKFTITSEHPGYNRIYDQAKAFTHEPNTVTYGDVREYYFLNFRTHTISKGQLFPADKDTSLVNYESLVFDKKFETEYENPFINKWTYAYISSEAAGLPITNNMPVAETDKAWYCLHENELFCIYKENTGLMYSFGKSYLTTYFLNVETAHSDYGNVYKITDAPAVVPNSEAIVYNENNDYSVAVVRDNTLRLHYCDLVTGVSIFEIDTGITCSADKKPTLNRYYVDNAYDLIVLSVGDTNTLFVSSKYRIAPLTYEENGEAVVIRKWSLEFGQDNNLNEFYVEGPYSEEKIYYKVNTGTSTCTTRQIFPVDSNTSPFNLFEIVRGETTIPESDPFFGKWDRAYGHRMPDNVFFENEGVECYETDDFWCNISSVNNAEGIAYVIMKDNPDYMYMYPHIIGADYRLCNYDRVFERADITEKPNVLYVKFDSFSVKLSYTTGLKTTLRKLEAVRGADTLASLDIHYELSTEFSTGTYWDMREHELKDGNIISLRVWEDGQDERLVFYHCTSNAINEIKLYDVDGNETIAASYGATCSVNDNVLMINNYTESMPLRFEVDFENNTATQFYGYSLESDTSEMPDLTSAEYDTKTIEEVFYGQWELDFESPDDANPGGGYRYHYDPLIFSYIGRCVDYPSTSLINAVYEDEKGWYAVGKNGGGDQLCYVSKTEPDILYYYQYRKTYMNQFDKVYKRSDKEVVIDTITAPSQLTAMGVRKLAETTGFNIFDPPESVSYDKSKKWVLGDVYREGIGEIYLTSLSENKITYCRRAWPDGEEPELYPEEYAAIIPNHDVFVYLTFTAEKIDGKWKVTSVSDKYARELYELVYELKQNGTDVYDAVINLIISNYRSDEFWDESINPEKQRITAEAIKKFSKSFSPSDDMSVLSDSQLVYTMCLNTYWQ